MVIFLVVEHGIGPVKLLGNDEAHQLVGKGKGGEGKFCLRAFQHGGINAKSAADEYDQLAGAGIGALLQEVGQLQGGHGFSPFIQGQQVVLRLQHVQYHFSFLFFQFRNGKAARLFHGGD